MPPPPPGYMDFVDELEFLTAFKGIVLYNYTVFGEQYHKIMKKEAAQLTSSTSDEGTENVACKTPSTSAN